MTMATITQARDEVQAQVKAVWDAGASTAGKTLLYDEVSDEKPDAAEYGNVFLRHGPAPQKGFGSGVRRYENLAFLTVQIFTPKNKGLAGGDGMVQDVKAGLQAAVTSPGGAIFRNVRSNEIGISGQWFQTNVLADIEYDEVR